MTSRRRRRTGSRLFAMYVVASLVPVGLLGAVLVRGYHDGAVGQATVNSGR